MTTEFTRRRAFGLLLGATCLRPTSLFAQDCTAVYASLNNEINRVDDWVANEGAAYLDQLQANLDGLRLQLQSGITQLAVAERVAFLDGLSLTTTIVLGVCGIVSGSLLAAIILGGIGLVVSQGLIAAKAMTTGQYSTTSATEAEVITAFDVSLSQGETIVLAPRVTLQGVYNLFQLVELSVDLFNGFQAQSDRWEQIVNNANLEAKIDAAAIELAALREPAALAAHRRALLEALLARLVEVGGACVPVTAAP